MLAPRKIPPTPRHMSEIVSIEDAKMLPEQFPSRHPQYENRNMSRFRYVDPKSNSAKNLNANPTPKRSRFWLHLLSRPPRRTSIRKMPYMMPPGGLYATPWFRPVFPLNASPPSNPALLGISVAPAASG